MTVQCAYCSACDRNVPVIRMPRVAKRDTAPSHDADAEAVVCLDYGVRCTGALCPMFTVPAVQHQDLAPPDGAGPARS